MKRIMRRNWLKRNSEKALTLDTSFELWAEILDGGSVGERIDQNSVSGVIFALVRDLAVFEAYKQLMASSPKSHLNVPLFRTQFITSYLYMQAIRIRRLTDGSKTPKGATRNTDVYSLTRLLDDMLQQIGSGGLTREYLIKRCGTHVSDSGTTLVDGLCGTSGRVTKNNKIIKNLKKRVLLDKNKNLRAVHGIVDKLIVHSASSDSRKELRDLTYDTQTIERIIQDLAESYLFLNSFVRQASLGSLLPYNLMTYFGSLDDDEKRVVYNAIEAVRKKAKVWQANVLTWTKATT